MPKHSVELGWCIFDECKRLADKDGFVIFNNVLYKYFGTATNVVVPDGITAIYGHAFYNRRNLQSVILPESVKTIGLMAFKWCRNFICTCRYERLYKYKWKI